MARDAAAAISVVSLPAHLVGGAALLLAFCMLPTDARPFEACSGWLLVGQPNGLELTISKR